MSDNPHDDGEIASRPMEFLLAPRQLGGLSPMSTDRIREALENLEGVKIIDRITPTPTLSTLSAASGSTGDVLVAVMSEQRGRELQAQAGPNILMERNHLLDHLGLHPTFAFALPVPPPITPAAVRIKFRVVGSAKQPLPKAQLQLFSRQGFPVQAETDANGEAELPIFGGGMPAVDALYVKPFADHWEKWLVRPSLNVTGVNLLALDPLSAFAASKFPATPYIGWGQRLMGFDEVAAAKYSGKGVRVAIIDSGVRCKASGAQPHHPGCRLYQSRRRQRTERNDVDRRHAVTRHALRRDCRRQWQWRHSWFCT